jgi:hypothetical protein
MPALAGELGYLFCGFALCAAVLLPFRDLTVAGGVSAFFGS